MCHCLYLATGEPAPAVAATVPPTFSARPLEAAERTTLDLPFPAEWHVMELGSTSGCACDFHGTPPWAGGGGTAEGAPCRLLADYLRGLDAGAWLYSFWNAPVAPRPTGRLRAPIDWIATHWDPIPDGWLVEIDDRAPAPAHPWENGPIAGKAVYP
jgi:hypothetical protein